MIGTEFKMFRVFNKKKGVARTCVQQIPDCKYPASYRHVEGVSDIAKRIESFTSKDSN